MAAACSAQSLCAHTIEAVIILSRRPHTNRNIFPKQNSSSDFQINSVFYYKRFDSEIQVFFTKQKRRHGSCLRFVSFTLYYFILSVSPHTLCPFRRDRRKMKPVFRHEYFDKSGIRPKNYNIHIRFASECGKRYSCAIPIDTSHRQVL